MKFLCNFVIQLVNLIFFRHNISLKVTSGERKSVADRLIDRNVTDRKIVLIIDNCPARLRNSSANRPRCHYKS